MFNASALISEFLSSHVSLTRSESQEMQKRRDANVARLSAGLAELHKPPIVETINQGGNAMQTMTQQPEADKETRYDIDLGVVFEDAATKSPTTTKSWVRDAIATKASNLKSEPEAKKKCVRVVYAEGYQCDFPVLKRQENAGGSYTYSIAIGDEWIASDPAAVNRWFEAQAKDKSPSNDAAGYQLRRIIRLVKYFSKSQSHKAARKFPAGLVVTALGVECYRPVSGRDDEAFFSTLRALSIRSEHVPVFANGVQVSGAKDVERVKRLREAAVDAVKHLNELTDDATAGRVCEIWKKVFVHSFFDTANAEKCFTKADVETGLWVGAPAIIAMNDSERIRRAEEAARAVEVRGPSSKPWSR